MLPGVGAFGDAAANLRSAGFEAPLMAAVDAGLPLLGIGLGMQLLFEESEEMGHHRGLGVIPGLVLRFPAGMHDKPAEGPSRVRRDAKLQPDLTEWGRNLPAELKKVGCSRCLRSAGISCTTMAGIPYWLASATGPMHISYIPSTVRLSTPPQR